MARRLCFALLVVLSGCAPGKGAVVVTVKADGPLPNVAVLAVSAVLGGTESMPQDFTPRDPTMFSSTTLAIVFARDKSGPVTIRVKAKDDANNVVAEGMAETVVRQSQVNEVTILLPGVTPPDLRMPDLAIPDLARPIDLVSLDLKGIDFTMPPDLFFCKSDNDCGMRFCDVMMGRCAACQPVGSPNKGCPMGFSCAKPANEWVCEMGCAGDADCKTAPKTTCCNKVCVDITADSKHCNGCNKGCPGEQLCCKSVCKDQAIDLENCGGCGLTCMATNGTPQCKNRACVIASCKAPFDDCDGAAMNGCETDTSKRIDHCGGCDMACAPAHASGQCTAFKCLIAQCDPGFDNCDTRPETGCEVDLSQDAANCGKCAMKCAIANATAQCVMGQCAVKSCTAPFDDCDKDGKSCEVDTSSDVMNCGKCGMKCAAPANGTAKCEQSKCVAVCNQGFGDCDKDYLTGCEIDLRKEAKNCGTCGMVCKDVELCNAGKCENRVLVIGAAQKSYLDDVKKTLDGTGAFTAVDTFDASVATPTALQLAPYAAALVFSDTAFADGDMLGNRLADYYDAGGRVVLAVGANANQPLTGRFGDSLGRYALITPAFAVNTIASSGPPFGMPNSPLVKDVMTGLTATQARRGPGMVLNNGVIVAKWSTGEPLIVAGTIKGRGRADLNFFPVSSAVDNRFWNGDGDKLLRNALLYR